MIKDELVDNVQGRPVPPGFAVREHRWGIVTHRVYDVYRSHDTAGYSHLRYVGNVTVYRNGRVSAWRVRDQKVFKGRTIEWALDRVTDQPAVLVDVDYTEIELRAVAQLNLKDLAKEWITPGNYTAHVSDVVTTNDATGRTFTTTNYQLQKETAMARIYGVTPTGRFDLSSTYVVDQNSLVAERERALARVERIDRRLARIEEFGVDDYEAGEVLWFKWTPDAERTYAVAALKVIETDPAAVEYWVLTGPVLGSRRYTWQELVQFMVDGNVTEVYWASDYTRIV